jgi:hypothetical protein
MKLEINVLAMNALKGCLILFLFTFSLSYKGRASDSTLINGLKGYILAESGYKTRDQFFNTWSEGGKPAVVVYVSSKSSVGTFGHDKSRIIGCEYNEERAKNVARSYDSLGYHTLIYKTYGTGRTELSPRFMSYSPESKSFIVLHEFIHHYTIDKRLNLPPEYHEALGDILGNYGTIEFADRSTYVSKKGAKSQRARNEGFYSAINKSIERINNDSTQVEKVNAWCQRRVNRILKDDLFQSDRFDYKVNNAYLFRYRSYTEKYFVLKKVLKQQKSIRGFLTTIEKAANSNNFEKYLHDL